MALSLYIILCVCILIGAIFFLLARTTKEEKVSLEPPPVKGGTLFVPTVPYHVHIEAPEIMRSRLDPDELFVDYTIPGFERDTRGNEPVEEGEGSTDTPLDAKASTGIDAPIDGSAGSNVADGFDDARLLQKIEAEEQAVRTNPLFVDFANNQFVQSSVPDVFEQQVAIPVIVTPGKSANPELDPDKFVSEEEYNLARNNSIKELFSREDLFAHYETIMGKVVMGRSILGEDNDKSLFIRFMNELSLDSKERDTLLTLFYDDHPTIIKKVETTYIPSIIGVTEKVDFMGN